MRGNYALLDWFLCMKVKWFVSEILYGFSSHSAIFLSLSVIKICLPVTFILIFFFLVLKDTVMVRILSELTVQVLITSVWRLLCVERCPLHGRTSHDITTSHSCAVFFVLTGLIDSKESKVVALHLCGYLWRFSHLVHSPHSPRSDVGGLSK